MHIWKLEPGNLTSHDCSTSLYKSEVIGSARAPSDHAVRNLATAGLAIGVERQFGNPTILTPWRSGERVLWACLEGSEFDKDGSDGNGERCPPDGAAVLVCLFLYFQSLHGRFA
jgi:hypothetical protein